MMARCEQSKKTDNKLTSKIGVYTVIYGKKNMYVNKYKMNSVISHFKKKNYWIHNSRSCISFFTLLALLTPSPTIGDTEIGDTLR